MLSEISLQNPTIVRMLKWQVGITVAFAVIAGIVSGEHGAVSAVLGGLTNIFEKLGVADRLELALYAVHNGLHAGPLPPRAAAMAV